MKKKLLILILAAFPAASMLFAQQDWSKARQEIHDNIRLSASNLLAYMDPTEADVLTPPPKGYEPFYMSHYGRHGSRWLCGDGEYQDALTPLRKAKALPRLFRPERSHVVLCRIGHGESVQIRGFHLYPCG